MPIRVLTVIRRGGPSVIPFLSTLSTYMYIWNSLIKIFYRWYCCRGVLKFHVSLVAKRHSQGCPVTFVSHL